MELVVYGRQENVVFEVRMDKEGTCVVYFEHVLCWAVVRWNEGNGVVVLSPRIVSDVSRMRLALVSGLREDEGPSNALIYKELM